ncbi:MAG: DUF2203 domain-containing protein [Acidobacteria bacterium]|nr:DUF2203 domain-containing protein [Acidobacteriota bacterium]
MADRTFTLAQATALLPVLEGLLRQAMQARREAGQIENEFAALAERAHQTGGITIKLRHCLDRRALCVQAIRRIKDALSEIDAAGVQVKDLDIGLLDFPFALNDRLVLLCWRLGEPAIEHWHGIDEGFAARKPIDERFAGPAQ